VIDDRVSRLTSTRVDATSPQSAQAHGTPKLRLSPVPSPPIATTRRFRPDKADITLLIHHLRNLTPAEYTRLLTERSIPDSYGNVPSRAQSRGGLKSRYARLGSAWVHPEEIERFCFPHCAFRFNKIRMHLVEQPAWPRTEVGTAEQSIYTMGASWEWIWI
jgi:hypothetical protein